MKRPPRRRPCPACGYPLDPVITTPPPLGCGQSQHPLCDTGTRAWIDAWPAWSEALAGAA